MATQKMSIFLDFTSGGSLKKIQQELNNMTKNLEPSKLIGLGFSKTEATKLKTDYGNFSKGITESFNESTGKFNFEKLKQSFAASNIDAKEFESRLNKAGISGMKSFEQINKGLYGFHQELKTSQTLMDKLMFTFSNTARWRVANAALNSVTQSMQQAYYFAKDLDRSLTNISIVSGKTREEMAKFAIEANSAAKALSINTLAYTEAALVFYQQGLGTEAVKKMTEATLIGANITGENAQEMSTLLTATVQGFGLTADSAMMITDKLAAVGASTAADFYELATAMSKVAAIANTAGVSMDQVNAQIATIISTTKEAPEIVGNSLKSMYSRMLRFKADTTGTMTDDLGEAFSAPAVEKALQAFSRGQISMFETTKDGTRVLRDMGSVVEDIGNQWEVTGSKEAKMALASSLGGTYHLNRIMALFNGWKDYKDAVTDSLGSEGTALEQNAIFIESYQGHLNRLKATAESLYITILNPEALMGFTDMIRGLIEGVNSIIKLLGGFSTLFGGMGGLLASAFALAPITKFLGVFTKTRTSMNNFTSQQTKEEKEMALIRRVYSEERVLQLEREFELANSKRLADQQELKGLESKRAMLQDILALENGAFKQKPSKSPFYNSATDLSLLIKNIPSTTLATTEITPSKETNAFLNNYKNELKKIGITQKELGPIGKKAFGLINTAANGGKITVQELGDSYRVLISTLKNQQMTYLQNLGLSAKEAKKAVALLTKEININKKAQIIAQENTDNLRTSLSKNAETSLKWQQGIASATMTIAGFSAILSNEASSSTDKFNQSLGLLGTNLAMFGSGVAIQKSFDNYDKRIEDLQGKTATFGQKAGMMGKSVASGLLTTLGPMLAIQLAVMAVTYFITKAIAAIPSLKKTQEEITKNNSEIGSLKGKIEEINSLGANASPGEKVKLSLYEKQLTILEYQTKELEKQAATQLLFGTGVWGKGISGEIDEFKKQASEAGYLGNKKPGGSIKAADLGIRQGPTSKGIRISFADLTPAQKKEELDKVSDNLIELEKEAANKKVLFQVGMESFDKNSEEYKKSEEAIKTIDDTITTAYFNAAKSVDGFTAASMKATVQQKILSEQTVAEYGLDKLIAYQTGLDKLATIKEKLNSVNQIELSDVKSLIDENPKYETQILANINNKKGLLKVIKDIEKANRDIAIQEASDALESAKISAQKIAQTEGQKQEIYGKMQVQLMSNMLDIPGFDINEPVWRKIYEARVSAIKQTLTDSQIAIDTATANVISAQATYDAALKATGTSTTSVGSKTAIEGEDMATALIKKFNAMVENDKIEAKSLEKQIKAAQIAKDITEELRLQQLLYENQLKTIEDLKIANESIHQEADNVRAKSQFKDWAKQSESWFDANGQTTYTYTALLDSFTGKTDKASKSTKALIIDLFTQLSKLKGAYLSNVDAIELMGDTAATTFADMISKQAESIKSAQDLMIELFEKNYEKQKKAEKDRHNLVIDNIDAEMKKKEDQYAAEDYQKNVAKANIAIVEKRNQIAAMSMDTSIEGQARKAALKKELDDLLAAQSDDAIEHAREVEKNAFEDSKNLEDKKYDNNIKIIDDLSDEYRIFNEVQVDLASKTTAAIIAKYKAMGIAIGGVYASITKQNEIGSTITAGSNATQNPITAPTPIVHQYRIVSDKGITPPETQVGDRVVTLAGVYTKVASGNGPKYADLQRKVTSYKDLTDLYNTFYAPQKFKEGGLLDQTGPFWGDGTKSKPEYVLKNLHFEQLLETVKLSNAIIPSINTLFKTTSMPTSNNQPTQISSVINITGVDGENVNSLVKRIKTELWTDLDRQMGISGIR